MSSLLTRNLTASLKRYPAMSTSTFPTPFPKILTPKQLSKLLDTNPPSSSSEPRVIPVDASWFMPNDPAKRTGASTYLAKRIPTAKFFDLDVVKSHTSSYPHMIPTPETFADAMRALQISREDAVAIYDSPETGIFSAPRAAWTFRVFGHEKVGLLNNFKEWVEEGLPTTSGEVGKDEDGREQIPAYPVTEPDLSMVVDYEEVLEIAKGGSKGVQILDARPRGRFTGAEPEPRKGLSSGHIPNSISIPFSILLDPKTKTLLPKEELRKVLIEAGVSEDEGIETISACGTGVTAVIIDTALEITGLNGKKRRVYDGSWTEWAQRAMNEEGMIVKD